MEAASVSASWLFAAFADQQAEAYTAVLPLIAGGQIASAHDSASRLSRPPEALRRLIEDRSFGKVTLTVDAGRNPISGLDIGIFRRERNPASRVVTWNQG